MEEYIIFNGIRTHNLKNIDIKIKKKTLNLIIGPSGSGKSSLAYHTIADIGINEYMSMFNDSKNDPVYKIKEYLNISPTVPINQNNFNHNIRSTIGTYFGLNTKLSIIFASALGVDDSFFVLNKETNTCNFCHGIGYVKELDRLRIIDFNKKLKDNPFKCWQRYNDFYSKIIMKFCQEKNIDIQKNFNELTEKESHLLLYGESDNKFQIQFKHGNSTSSRTTKFYGIMTSKPMRKNFMPTSKFYSDIVCPRCLGMKFSKEHCKYTLLGKSIGEVMLMPFCELKEFFEKAKKEGKFNEALKPHIDFCYRFVLKTNELNLGHLFLNRTIPTLSGGELQRLRLVHVFNAQLTDLVIILDEPVAGLSGVEKEKVYDCIMALVKKHTVIVIDHSDLFLQKAENIIALGPGAGRNGGQIIDAKKYLDSQVLMYKNDDKFIGKKIQIILKGDVYLYKGVNITIAQNCTNIITGSSGVGKSTLIREYFSRYFEEYVYINQKLITGNQNSNVATLLNIATPIFNFFAKEFDKDKHFFSNASGKEGSCKTCNGAGSIEYGSTKLICGECNGSGFNEVLEKYKLYNKSILDIWKMTIEEAVSYFQTIDDKIAKQLTVACELLLSHLIIGQGTTTLSGGENVRIKLMKLENITSTVIGVDEPFKGLNPSEVYIVVNYINKLKRKGKTIVVADHSDIAIPCFDKHIEVGIENGVILELKR